MRILPPETMEARFGLQETIQVHNAPASLMPSCRICPSGAYQKHDNQVTFIEQITLVQFGILLTSNQKMASTILLPLDNPCPSILTLE